MSGRKQHYIPQSVLRSFEAARNGVKSQVLVFRKGRQPYLTATDGAAAERDFYSNPNTDGEGSLDDAITEFEGEHLAPILQELRSQYDGEVDGELASTAVAHLAIRTAHLRDTMSLLTGEALAQIKLITENSDALRRFTGLDSIDPDSDIAVRIREDLEKIVPETWPEKDRKALERMTAFRLRERFDVLVAQEEIPIRTGLAMMESSLTGAAPKAHARALSSSLVPTERVVALRRLRWQVCAADNAARHFILPDCVVVAKSDVAEEFRPFAMLSASEAALVVMPLSSRQLLIGFDREMHVDQAEINLQLARSSLDFFVSSRKDGATIGIAEEIGSYAGELKLDWLEEDEKGPIADQAPSPARRPHLTIRCPIGKSGDAIKKRLTEIANETVEPATLARIESITVPSNLSLALKAVWNREPNTTELQECASGTVELVKPGSEVMCRIILPRNLAETLVGKGNDQQQRIATRLTRFNLGRAYYFDCLVRGVPAIFDTSNLSHWAQATFRLAIRAGANYFGGLASVKHEQVPLPEHERFHELGTTLRVGIAGLKEARRRSHVHRDVDLVLGEALQSVEAILIPIAAICGLLDAKNAEMAGNSEAASVLQEFGLWEWYLLFWKDLRRHYERRRRWKSEAEFYQLAGHVERLLWTIGVVVTPLEVGYWVDVADDQKMEFLEKMLRM